jgi:hypothetical protein
MTDAVAPEDRHALADLIYRAITEDLAGGRWMRTVDGTGNVSSHVAADAVIASGWRPYSD